MKNDKVIIFYNPEFEQLTLMWKGNKCKLTHEQVAKKDVPKGLPYKILDSSDLPSDLSFIDAWEDDFTGITDVGEYVK